MDVLARDRRLDAALALVVVTLAAASLMVGPAGLSPRAALYGLIDDEGPAGIILRDIRLPRTLLAVLIGATLGLAGAALQGLLPNPLAEPALFGAPQAAAACASAIIAFGLALAISLVVPPARLADVFGITAVAMDIDGCLVPFALRPATPDSPAERGSS